MRPDIFDLYASLLKQRSGLVLSKEKEYLLESRLGSIAAKWKVAGLEGLAGLVRGRNEAVIQEITEAMTTNESTFFRDQRPFDQFRDIVLPRLLQSRAAKKTIRIWSAACSSGQEAYSLAMMLSEESARLAGWRVEIIGTDISREMVERAKSGDYSQFEVQRGLPIKMLMKHFRQEGERWRINQQIRQMATFKEWNLLQDLTPLGQFDVVFCRNVLIYFDQPTKGKVLDAIARQMPPDGMLWLGGAETVLGITNRFKPVDGQRGMYVPS